MADGAVKAARIRPQSSSLNVLKATFDDGPVVTAGSESSNPSELWTFVTP
jgi:hypothetical protein